MLNVGQALTMKNGEQAVATSPNDGVRLERLVHALQRALRTRDAEIKTREHVADRRTGGVREVDVTVRLRVGVAAVMVAFECRDRRAVADVRWIEELASKKEGIGASELHAVSARGFTAEAKALAQLKGIHAWSEHDLTTHALAQWADGLVVEALRPATWGVTGVFALLDGNEDFVELRAAEPLRADHDLVCDRTTGEALTLGDLLTLRVQSPRGPIDLDEICDIRSHWSELLSSDRFVTILDWAFEPRRFLLASTTAELPSIDILVVEIATTVARSVVPAGLATLSVEGGQHILRERRVVELGGQRVVLEMASNADHD